MALIKIREHTLFTLKSPGHSINEFVGFMINFNRKSRVNGGLFFSLWNSGWRESGFSSGLGETPMDQLQPSAVFARCVFDWLKQDTPCCNLLGNGFLSKKWLCKWEQKDFPDKTLNMNSHIPSCIGISSSK